MDTTVHKEAHTSSNNNSLTHHHGSPALVQYVNADVAEVSRTWRKNFGSLQSMCLVYKNADKLKNALDQAQPHSADAYSIKLWFEKVQREARHLSQSKLLDMKQYFDKGWLQFDFSEVDLGVPTGKPASSNGNKRLSPLTSNSNYSQPSPTKLSHILIQTSIDDSKKITNEGNSGLSTATSNLHSREISPSSNRSVTPVRETTTSSSMHVKSTNAPPTSITPIRVPSNPTSVPVRAPQPIVQPCRQPTTPRSSSVVSKTTAKKGRKPNKNTIRKQVKESNDQIWFEHLNLLLKYSDEHGNCNVPLDYVTEMDGIRYRLGEWLEIQRAVFYDVGECDVEKFNILEELILNKGLWCTDVSPDEAAAAEAYRTAGSSSSSSSSSTAKHMTSSLSPHSFRMALHEELRENTDVGGDDGFNDEQLIDDTIITLAPMKRKEIDQSSAEDQSRSQKLRTARGRSTKSKGSGLVAEQKQKKIRRTRSKKCTNDSDDDSIRSHDGNGFDSDPELRFDSDDGNESSDHEVHITTTAVSSSSLRRSSKETSSAEMQYTALDKEEVVAETKVLAASSLALDSIPISESDNKSSGTSTAQSSPGRNPAMDPQANGGLLTRHTKLGRSKQSNLPVVSADEPNYLGFLYGIDGSKDVYFAIGMVKQQTMSHGCLTYSLELMKPKDPANFLDSEFFLEPDEKSQIRHHHIVQQNLRFDKGKSLNRFTATFGNFSYFYLIFFIFSETNTLETESRRNLRNRLKTMPHLKIDGAENAMSSM